MVLKEEAGGVVADTVGEATVGEATVGEATVGEATVGEEATVVGTLAARGAMVGVVVVMVVVETMGSQVGSAGVKKMVEERMAMAVGAGTTDGLGDSVTGLAQ